MAQNTHLLVCKNPTALNHLLKDETCCRLIAHAAQKGNPIAQGDALVARDELLNAGFKWGTDFYIKKV